MLNPNTMIKIARLHKDKIEEYKKLHSNVPEQIIKHLAGEGIKVLNIYLLDDILVMVLLIDPASAVKDFVMDQEQEDNWNKATDDCFQSVWEDADLIFKLDKIAGE